MHNFAQILRSVLDKDAAMRKLLRKRRIDDQPRLRLVFAPRDATGRSLCVVPSIKARYRNINLDYQMQESEDASASDCTNINRFVRFDLTAKSAKPANR